jgi:formylglycine-generating enzyme required for sulfatase activity
MRLPIIALATALLVLIVPEATSAQTAFGVLNVWLKKHESADAPNDQQITLYQKSKALVIGMDHYSSGWPQLSNGVKDAEEVAKALTAQGFEVMLRKDLKSEELDRTLKNFFVGEGADVDTRLLLWFAGHGYTVRDEGYIVPVDAPSPKADAEFREKAISLRRFGEYMREANSRHVLAIFDSCFGGSVFHVARSAPPPAITRATTEPVREFISSGDAEQEVSDDGTFRKLFLDILAGKEPDADANHDGYVTGTELGLFLNQKITNLTDNRQTPRYGKLNVLGYDRGDFVFQVGKPDVPTTAPVTIPQPTSDAAQAWVAAQGTTSQAVLEDYIKHYGDSFYGTLARDRLNELKVRECDRLAASPYDTLPVGIAGISFEQVDPVKAIPACRGALVVRPDDPRISYQLGRALQKSGEAPAYAEAVQAYRKAAEAGNTSAMVNLGSMYKDGKGVARDEAEAVRWFRKAADAGHAVGMINLGTMYAGGGGVAKDEAEAVRWYRRAADAGVAPGMTSLGAMYETGRGVTQDYAAAVGWYRKAVEASYAPAMANLGVMYEYGMGVAKDEAEAVRWYRMAADAGAPRGMTKLGVMYEIGQGVAKNHEKAREWYEKAVAAGDPDAKAGLDRVSDELKKSQVAVVAQPAAAPSPPASSSPCGGTALVLVSSRSPRPLSAAEECALKPKDAFKECDKCPEMVVIPAGNFTMGSPSSERDREIFEEQVRVTIPKPFAVGRFAVTFDEWDACAEDGGCASYKPSDQGWGHGRHPVINVSWDDARKYVAWLNRKTGHTYRLLSEAEREYVTRAGTTSPFWWGSAITPTQANYDGRYEYPLGRPRNDDGLYRGQTVPVDSFVPNPWGLYNVHGNVWEWTEDCWKQSNSGNPGDGSARTSGDCTRRVLRGGSWYEVPLKLRAAERVGYPADSRINSGLRVGRTLGVYFADLRERSD